MKSLPLLIASSLPVFALPDNPLLPGTWFHELTATDGSTQQSIVFTTVPGVEYTFYHSNELETWTEVGRTYGLGHQFAAAMRETAPAPPPPDPENPPPPAEPLQYASILIQPSSATEGGTVVSWVSLDHGNAVQYLIPGNMVTDWYSVPMFAGTHNTHHFFVNHPPGTTAPPGENPLLDTKDASMIADLEAAWAAFNTAVTNTVETARNTPPPPPPSPDAKGFWRIKADWSLDSDNDGIADHAEFALAASEEPEPDGLVGNAFSADTNGDGIPDGEQLDSDGDGVPDALDIAAGSRLIAYQKTALPRYAAFDTGGYGYQINDRGTVLFLNGSWKAGETVPLAASGNGLSMGFAVSLNNHDEILGLGSRTIPRDETRNYSWRTAAFWTSPDATPVPVQAGQDYPSSIWDYDDTGFNQPAPILSDDRTFFAESIHVQNGNIQGDGENKIWTIAAGGASATVADLPAEKQGLMNGPGGGLFWGLEPVYPAMEGRVFAPGALPLLPALPINVIPHTIPGDSSTAHIATYREDTQRNALIHHDGGWKENALYSNAIDISADGTAIGRDRDGLHAPILLNGRWTALERAVPGLPAGVAETYVPIDTTPNGWILTYGTSAALLPLRVTGRYANSAEETIEVAAGVDDFSIGSSNPALSPDNIDHVQDRIWIMVPSADSGGAKEIVIDAPIHESAPVTLSAEAIRFGGEEEMTVTATGQSLQVKAHTSAVSGAETLMDIKMGPTASVSKPVGFKVMKDRRIKVVVWLVTSDRNAPGVTVGQPGYVAPGAPEFAATEEELEHYLDDIYKPQVNLGFDCEYREITVRFDTATGADFGISPEAFGPGSFVLNTVSGLGQEFDAIRAAGYDTTASVNLYLLGDTFIIRLHAPTVARPELHYNAVGMANRDERIAVVPTHLKPLQAMLDTVAHEIGHIVVGLGHPDDNGGPAPLPGTAHPERLMCSGEKRRKDGSSRLLTKAEWDAAEVWLLDELERISELNEP